LTARRHYLRLATEHIDKEIARLKERKADIEVEIIREDRKATRTVGKANGS